MQEIVTTGGEDAQAIVQWDPNSGAALPAYLTGAADELGTNIPDRMTVPSLSYEGKVWQIVKDGNKTKLQTTNGDGDTVPVPIMRVVVLSFNNDRGRAYYPGTYDPSRTDKPKCWSPDGKAPDASVVEKQSSLCNGCPMSVKGSKVDGGKELVACGQHRMIAVVPAFEIMSEPLRLKIAVTSDYDKEIVEHGWFAFRQYVDFLKSRGVTHTGLVVTKIKFDAQQAYPKLLFALDRILTPAELGQMKEQLQNPKVAQLLAETWTAAGSAGTPIDNRDIRPSGLEGAYADGWIAHPDAAGYSYKGQEVVANEELAARYPAPEPEAAAPPPSPPPPPAAPPPPAEEPAAVDPLAAALADGWVAHPQALGYHYKGQEVVADADLAARYSAPAPAAVPAAPEPEPAPPQPHGLEAAVIDGWVVHPDAPGYHYRGQEVVADGELAARYPSAAVPAASTAGTPATLPGSAGAASPSDPATDPSVAALLSKWTQ